MIAAEFINTLIPALDVSDKAQKALTWMEECRCRHLPVVNEGRLLGFVSEEAIAAVRDTKKPIGELDLVGASCVVHPEYHFYDVLKVAGQQRLDMVGVVDLHKEYQGVVMAQDIMTSVAQTLAVQTQGSILILSINTLDYSLSEIARLIEENNARILSAILVEDEIDENKVKLNIKIDQLDITHVVATLERFGYNVIGKYQAHNDEADPRHERIDLLMRYLNM